MRIGPPVVISSLERIWIKGGIMPIAIIKAFITDLPQVSTQRFEEITPTLETELSVKLSADSRKKTSEWTTEDDLTEDTGVAYEYENASKAMTILFEIKNLNEKGIAVDNNMLINLKQVLTDIYE